VRCYSRSAFSGVTSCCSRTIFSDFGLYLPMTREGILRIGFETLHPIVLSLHISTSALLGQLDSLCAAVCGHSPFCLDCSKASSTLTDRRRLWLTAARREAIQSRGVACLLNGDTVGLRALSRSNLGKLGIRCVDDEPAFMIEGANGSFYSE
jgi:hypothetical protein